tara:strand:+ start:116 stop:355 length:240 start_codon:yes stop_codon:yes gene_type:complete
MLITGATTCAADHAAPVIASLDDCNQYMNHLLVSNVISNLELSLVDCRFFQVQALVSRSIQMLWIGQQKRINQVYLSPI